MDRTYHAMEQKSLLDLGLCRTRRGLANCNWLPEDLRKSIVNLGPEEHEHPILDWLKQIRFTCAGDFNDISEFGNFRNVIVVDLDLEDLLRDMDGTLRAINCSCYVGDDEKCKVDFSQDGHACGGVADGNQCHKGVVERVSGDTQYVECNEDVCKAIERRSTTSDSDSSSQTSLDLPVEDLPQDESDDSVVLRSGRALSAISEVSEENFTEHSECHRRYNVNSIFDDGLRVPVPPTRRRTRKSLPAKLGAESEKKSEYSSSHDAENRRSYVDGLKTSAIDKDIFGETPERLFRSLVDIPQAIRTEYDDSQDFLLIDRVCRSTKLKRCRKNDHPGYGTYPVVQRRYRKSLVDISAGSDSYFCKADELPMDDYRQFLRSMTDPDNTAQGTLEIVTEVESGHLNNEDAESVRSKRSIEAFDEANSVEVETDNERMIIDKDGLNKSNSLDTVDDSEVEVFQPGNFVSEAETKEKYANLETMDTAIVNINNDGLGRPNPLDPVNVDNPDVEVFDTVESMSAPKTYIDNNGLNKPNPLDNVELYSKESVIEYIDDDGVEEPNALDSVNSDFELLPSKIVEHIDEDGLDKENPLDNVNTDVELLYSKETDVEYIDDNGVGKPNALDSVINSDFELLPSKVVERLHIDEDGLDKRNLLDITNTDADVELIQPKRIFHLESAVRNLKNVEEPESESVDVDDITDKSNFSLNDVNEDKKLEKSNTTDNTVIHRFKNMELSSEAYFNNDLFRTNSMETEHDRDDTEIITTEADGLAKPNPLEKNSPGSDEHDLIFESFESDRSFYSALDKASRSDCESCPESLPVLEEHSEKKNWSTADEDEDMETMEAPKVAERLYVNFPLKGNTENPDLTTSTPNKPIRKRAAALKDFDSGYSPSASRKVYEDLVDARIRFRERKGSMSSDVVHWMNSLMSSVLNDKYENDEDVVQWFSSNDAEGKIYFFEQNSNESSWALPSIRITGTEESSAKSGISTSSEFKSNAILTSQDVECVLKEGSINRTKITENGKKLRKNWSTSHVVLTELFLLFFKDAKTFAAMKTGQSASAKPDISVDLNGALVEPGERASSRKNVYIISTVLGLQVLIQSDNATIANEWYQEIHSAISRLPSGFETHSKMSTSLDSQPGGKHFLDASSPEESKRFAKIGRSRSVKIKRPDGSLEDLSGTAAERQTRIKAKLRRFFQRRPTMDSLVKNGIYKDEPAFGSYLSDVCPAEPPRIPRFVKACIEVLENNTENMKTDGLYRASGNLSQIQKIRLQVDQNNFDVLTQEEDVHVLTGALKLFFRELKEPLIPFAFFERALNASMSKKRLEKIQCFKEIVKALPPANHDTLQFLLQHLLRVTSYQEYNRMHIPNLAIVFGPTLMWPAEESANMALDLMQQNLVIECLLSDYDRIFK
ncbi:rho-type GTPase-activating protein 2 isoform X2 [Cephus cinctus]|uniref:Rho-type GTPase-activating protein 2 isoform X2 n=1 Tax=Cephus cinctus TaxID=211228 RepID=A0AAJ7RP28_CEPCN|nr:rho-type GTPase-activating protein 2 isoform X2 [Cephus cinctus]